MTSVRLTPGKTAEGDVVLDLSEGTQRLLLGDRTSWLPDLPVIVRGLGINVQTPFPKASSPLVRVSHHRVLTRVRSRIETVCLPCLGTRSLAPAQSASARDAHAHPLCILFHPCEGRDPLQRAALVAA
jgi:hypothetical protein